MPGTCGSPELGVPLEPVLGPSTAAPPPLLPAWGPSVPGSLCARLRPCWAPVPLLPEPKYPARPSVGRRRSLTLPLRAPLSLPRVTARPRWLCVWSTPSSCWRLLRMEHSQMEFRPWHGLGGGRGGAFPPSFPQQGLGSLSGPSHCCRSPGVWGCSLVQPFNPVTF